MWNTVAMRKPRQLQKQPGFPHPGYLEVNSFGDCAGIRGSQIGTEVGAKHLQLGDALSGTSANASPLRAI